MEKLMKPAKYFGWINSLVLALFIVALALATTATTQAADETKEYWVLLSDIHIPGQYDKVQNGYKPNEHFAQIRDEILIGDAKPKGIIITGDVAFLQGEEDDYQTLSKQLEPFTLADISVYMLLGNHDSYENLSVNAEKYAIKDTPVKGKQVVLVETPNANWFFLDSHIDTTKVAGLLGEEQLKWLSDELEKHPDKPAILAAHHNLDPGDGTLQDANQLWEIVKSHKQVKAYIYGHTHGYRASVRDDVHLINLPALAWRFDEVQPLGWTEAILKPKGLELKLHTLDKNHPKNDDVRTFEWLR